MEVQYVKIIHAGNELEIYEYEKEPFRLGRPRKKKKERVSRNISFELSVKLLRRKRVDNERRRKSNFTRLVKANLWGTAPPFFFTFTFAKDVGTIQNGYFEWSKFIDRLRLAEGKRFSYIVVPEFGTKNTQRLHFHALFWGLDDVKCRYERDTRYFASIWKNGFIDVFATDGHPRLASYFAKYMHKALSDDRLCNQKAYRASRNVLRYQTLNTSLQISYLEEIVGFSYKKLSTTEPLLEREYKTEWLGKGRFKLYNLYNVKSNESNFNDKRADSLKVGG